MMHAGSMAEVFQVFLRLGLTSFGGPIAHLAYFRDELVEKRGWLSEEQYAQLVALCQFMPGPASSQVGFCLGLMRAGWRGALAAFVAFTLPSVLLLLAFAGIYDQLGDTLGLSLIQGLKIVALAVVAHAVLGMAGKLCPDARRASIAVGALAGVLLIPMIATQVAVVVAGGLLGWLMLRQDSAGPIGSLPLRHGKSSGALLLGLAAAGLVALPVLAHAFAGTWQVAEAFYRSGALVFGGGHVVLPLLEESLVRPGLVDEQIFIAGYGAAQAVPGPLFSIAGYLGFMAEDGGWVVAMVAVLAMFAPGFLLVAGILPFWQALSARPGARQALAGVNAAVVGILGAALYQPLWQSAVDLPIDLVIAVAAFVLLQAWKCSALWVVVFCLATSALASYCGLRG
ncbi:MAG: chromate efflux transporter [Planctomycetota bacterium]|nr:MAG: chromate efflux transporter [Planctomycetota bacterium]